MINENKINNWSFSKSRQFVKCPRAFYYSVKNHGFEKNKTSISTIIGQAVHIGINRIIDRWQKGKDVQLSEINSEVKQLIKSSLDNSNHIIEKVNRFEISNFQRSYYLRIAKEQIDKFYLFIWPQYRNHKYIEHEKLDNFSIDEITVWVKVDLLTIFDNQYFIIDWKTDKGDRYYDYLPQLHTYGIWARYKYGISYDDIILQIVNLSKGSIHTFKFDENIAMKMLNSIEAQIKEWKRRKYESDFQQNASIINCMSCISLEMCDKGRNVLHYIEDNDSIS